jgi:hypothetical protein
MAQIVEVVGVGEVEFPDGMSKEDIGLALQKLPKPKFVPTPQNRGNIINSDVPTVVGSQPNAVNPQPAQAPRTMGDYVKALYEVPTTVITGAAAPFIGVGAGIAENIRQGTNKRVDRPELAQRFTYEPRSPVSQDVVETLGTALEASKIPAYVPSVGRLANTTRQGVSTTAPLASGNLPSFNQATQAVKTAPTRMATALRDEGQMIKQAVQPALDVVSDVASPVTNRMADALRSEPKIDISTIAKTAPSTEDLATRSSQLFKQAKDANVELDAKDFSNTMKGVGLDLRGEGYDPRLYPKLEVAFSELQNAKMPKDFNELKTLRKFIQGAQKSIDPEEKRLATMLKDKFDDYVLNIPESSVKGGSKEGLQAWKEARDTYSKMSKSDVFTDMLEIAELEKTQFSASGAENSLSKQLRQLAKNDKKMRLFTKEEQAAIRQVAKGSTTQNVLRLFGKFAPTSSVNTILPLLATSVSGPIGLGLTAGALGARYGATKMRKSDVENLAALMRAGIKKEKE